MYKTTKIEDGRNILGADYRHKASGKQTRKMKWRTLARHKGAHVRVRTGFLWLYIV